MILAFDAGTTTFKGAIIDQQGLLIARERMTYDSLPGYTASGPQVSPQLWIDALVSVSKKLWAACKKSKTKTGITGVVISGNGPTIVPVDANGKILGDALSWADELSLLLVDELGLKIGGITDPSFYLAKIFLLQKNKPRLYEKTRWFLPCPEFLSYFLTGNASAILPAPGFESVMWANDSLEKAGLDREKFPPFIAMGTEIGRITGSAGDAAGIPEGTPVFAGGPDFIMSLLGASAISPGQVCDRTGTSEGINLCSAAPVFDPRLFCLPHIRKGFFNISAILSTAGSASDWFLKIISGKRELYGELYASLETLPAGAEKLFFLPQMRQSRSGFWPLYRKGAFAGLSPEHTKEHLFKAIIEGVGFAMREIIELLEEKTSAIDTIRVSGMQAAHDEWNRIRADILGKQILVPAITDTELAGCACVGFASSGVFSDAFEASESLVHMEKKYSPDLKKQKVYDDLFGYYKEMYITLENTFRKLSGYNPDEC